MYWLAHLASASLVPRPLAARRRADCFMAVCALGRTHSMWAVSCTFLRFVVNVVLANVALASAGYFQRDTLRRRKSGVMLRQSNAHEQATVTRQIRHMRESKNGVKDALQEQST